MKHIALSLFALSVIAAPLSAGQETPMQVAQRIDACNGHEVLEARMTGDNRLAVSCGDAVTGDSATAGPVLSSQNAEGSLGNGLAAPAAALGALALVVGAFAGGSSSSDTQ